MRFPLFAPGVSRLSTRHRGRGDVRSTARRDKEFVRHLDEDLPNLNYARVVHGGDLFVAFGNTAIITSNEGRFAVEYAHAGSMLWTDANDENGSSATTHLYRAKGSKTPPSLCRTRRMLNPVTVANHHSGYARFFDEDETIYDAWPERIVVIFCVPLRSMRTRSRPSGK